MTCKNCYCCNKEILKLIAKNRKLRRRASRKQLRKAGKPCYSCCQNKWAILRDLGVDKPGDRAKLCCCLRKQNRILSCPFKLKEGCWARKDTGLPFSNVIEISPGKYSIRGTAELRFIGCSNRFRVFVLGVPILEGFAKSSKKLVFPAGGPFTVLVWLSKAPCLGNLQEAFDFSTWST